MTPQELAELPVGTRVRFLIEDSSTQDETILVYDFGTIGIPGVVTHVSWDDGPTSLIDTKSKVWEGFIAEMEVDA
jgi:hypothetical protein